MQATVQKRPEATTNPVADDVSEVERTALLTNDTATIPSPTTAPSPVITESKSAILFYDGACGLCSNAVDFVIRRDRSGLIKFAPLQGETAARMLNRKPGDSLNSMILVETDRTSSRSDAACRILALLGGGWAVLGGMLWCIPRFARNIGYQLVASNRYRIWGQKESCRMPTPAERERFLP